MHSKINSYLVSKISLKIYLICQPDQKQKKCGV